MFSKILVIFCSIFSVLMLSLKLNRFLLFVSFTPLLPKDFLYVRRNMLAVFLGRHTCSFYRPLALLRCQFFQLFPGSIFFLLFSFSESRLKFRTTCFGLFLVWKMFFCVNNAFTFEFCINLQLVLTCVLKSTHL